MIFSTTQKLKLKLIQLRSLELAFPPPILLPPCFSKQALNAMQYDQNISKKTMYHASPQLSYCHEL